MIVISGSKIRYFKPLSLSFFFAVAGSSIIRIEGERARERKKERVFETQNRGWKDFVPFTVC